MNTRASMRIIVEREVTGTAWVEVIVPVSVEGSYESPESRARSYVLAAMAAGQPLDWVIVFETELAVPASYKLTTRGADESGEPPEHPEPAEFAEPKEAVNR